MARKIVVTEEQVTKVAYTSIQLQSGELQKRVTMTLKCGDRIVMREGSVEFQRVGLFIKQGDIVSFEADDFRESSFKPEEDKDRTISLKELQGLNLETLVIKPGLWDEKPFSGLEGRSATTDFAAPRSSSGAPPIGGQASFTPPPVSQDQPAATGTTGTAQF